MEVNSLICNQFLNIVDDNNDIVLYERDLLQNGHERLQWLIFQLIPIRCEAEELRILGDQYLIKVADEELDKA